MLLSEYLSDLTETINELSKTGLILSPDIKTDFRSKKIGLIKGALLFINGSELFFKGTMLNSVGNRIRVYRR